MQTSTASNFLEILNNHHCPYTQDVDESYVSELLLTEGEHRIRLLLWIFGEIHPFSDQLVNSQELFKSRACDLGVDKRVQILTSIGASLGLCRAADLDLMRGKSSAKKQVSFWKKLLNIFQYSSDKSLNEAYQEDQLVMHEVQQVKLSRMKMDDELELLPHYLARQIKTQKKTKKRLMKKDFVKYEEELKLLSENLEEQQENLEELEKTVKYMTKDDSTTYENIARALILNLSDLDQMMTAFEQVHDNSFSAFCNREDVSSGNLGPLISIVSKQLSYVKNVFDNLETIKNNHEDILKCTKQWPKTKQKVSHFLSIFDQFTSNSLQCFDELSQTLNHQQSNTVNTTNDSIASVLAESKLHEKICDISSLK